MGPQIDDCWNRIGVHGDSSCPELTQHAHCRNCPVYSAAAADLLNRDPPPGYLTDRTRHFEQADAVGKSETRSAIVFRIGPEWFALSTLAFDEVADQRAIHTLPHRRGGGVLGLVNIRGELLICLSLAKIMGLEEAAASGPAEDRLACRRLIILRHAAGRLAFPVDEVQSIHSYDPADLRAVPATVAKAAASYTTGVFAWSDRVVGCLDSRRVLEALNRGVT
ncbi:chemotaxis protein CheW [Phenylobacterium sp. LjRoot225]|uniref:chemotaxis protein CheW n=1 Tax=Phenylobacterium sp. LjRoot225 TaxID=3342285 RepID=UPI003ED08D11